MSFHNLEQRTANSYLDMFPKFYPNRNLPTLTQEQFYLFMKNIYKTIYEMPGIFFRKLYEDDAYPNRFNKASYGKPALYQRIKSELKEVDEFLTCLYDIGRDGTVVEGGIRTEISIRKKHRDRFSMFGLRYDGNIIRHDRYEEMYDGWKFLATMQHATVTAFSRCMFDPQHLYMEDIYAALFGESVFSKLSKFMMDHGCQPIEMERDIYTLDYAKNVAVSVSGRQAKLGSPLHGDPYHIGFAFEYKPETKVPQYTVLRIQKMKDILKHIGDAPENVKNFILSNQKRCNLCGYCTLTDMTGTRLRQTVEIDEQEFCTLYPGFSFCFSQISDTRANDIMDFFSFMERFF